MTHFSYGHLVKNNLIYFSKILMSFIQKQPPRGVPIKGVLQICSKFTGEHPCQSVISNATLLKSHLGMGVLL